MKNYISTIMLMALAAFSTSTAAAVEMTPADSVACDCCKSEHRFSILPFFASNWGATTSLGVPRETREIGSAPMNYNYAFGCFATQMFNNHWGIRSGLALERKGGNSNVIMKDYLTKVHINNAPEETVGYFSGRSETWHDMLYVTMPLTAVYRLNDQWDFHFGAYVGYAVKRDRHGRSSEGTIRESLLSPVAPVDNSESDCTYGLHRWDYGVDLGMTHPLWRKLYFTCDIEWGLANTWDGSDYGMTKDIYNLYARLGLGWKF